MKNCSLYLYSNNTQEIKNHILSSFQNIGIEAKEDKLGEIILVEKSQSQTEKLLKINILLEGQDEFTRLQESMMNYVIQIDTPHGEIQADLMVKIQKMKCALGIVSSGSLEIYSENITSIIDKIGGFGFIDESKWVNSKLQTILNIDGNTDFISERTKTQEIEVIDDFNQERKIKSINVLREYGIPFINHLPLIVSDNETQLRTLEEITKRTIATTLAAVKG